MSEDITAEMDARIEALEDAAWRWWHVWKEGGPALEFYCVDCKGVVYSDEDGCCASCGEGLIVRPVLADQPPEPGEG
jgi:hypothetical protein